MRGLAQPRHLIHIADHRPAEKSHVWTNYAIQKHPDQSIAEDTEYYSPTGRRHLGLILRYKIWMGLQREKITDIVVAVRLTRNRHQEL